MMTTPEELRTLVAEKVMGYKSTSWFAEDDSWAIGQFEGMDECIEKERWDPLESWADAGRVIERMSDMGFDMTLSYGPHGDDVLFRHVEDDRCGYSKGKSIQRHISLAALRALGVEVE